MKVLAVVVLFLSLPSFRHAPAPRTPVDRPSAQHRRKGGSWYFAETGHAVYCRGPVMMVAQPTGELQRVATFCQGEKTMVPLKD
jgi:hypothetical protein